MDRWLPTVTRYLALAGLAYELIIDKLKNPTALVVFGGLAGLPDVIGYRAHVKAEVQREEVASAKAARPARKKRDP